jgi:hypothetical protein
MAAKPQSGKADGDVGLSASRSLVQGVGFFKWAGFVRDHEQHGFAKGDDV